MRMLLASALAFATLAVGCREPAPRQPTVGAEPANGKSLRVRGELTEGAECPILVTSDGRRLALGGDLRGFKPGDRVCARGRLVEVSSCMAGEATLALESIGPESECP